MHAALAHGRSWTVIADRLGMTPTQAKQSYGMKVLLESHPERRQSRTIGSVLLALIADMLRAASTALTAAENMAREHSRR